MKKRRFQRCLSLLLAASMAIPTIGNFTVFAGDVPSSENWTGCTACSEKSPHMISTKADLDHIRTHLGGDGHVNGYFKLANDIVFDKADFEGGGAFYNGGLGWMPIGHDGTTHSENADYEPAICDIWLDGNGYTISGLEHYSRPGDITSGKDSWGNTPAIEYSGLIGIAGDATIQDLVIEDTLMYLQYGGGAIYGAGSNGTVVDNVTLRNVEVLNQYIYSGSDGAAAAFGIAGGRISNITLENCGSLFHSAEENGDQCWHSALFADRILSGTTIDGVTITDCQLDVNKDSGLFSTYLGDKGETTVSNIRVANVTVDGLEVNRAHPFVAYFAYDTYAYNTDPTAFTARYPKTYENVTFENISMDAAVNYSGYTAEPAKMLPDLVPQAAGVTLKNSVMVYHQGADYALFTEDTLAGVYSNVYVVRDLKDAAATVIWVAADGTRSEAAVAVPESLTLQVGGVSEETLSLNLEGAELSYESSDESTAKLLEDGKVQGVGEGTTDIRVMVRMTEEMSLPLLRTEVIVEGPNKDALALRYDECVAASEDDYYTEETREALKEAAEKAKLVLDSRTATQADVDTALAALEQAIGEMLPSDYHLDSLIYEGRSNVTVYVSETANALEKFAMTELQKYLGLVGDVRISQVASVKPGQNLQIVLGTPKSYPELTELFPEDLEYLADSDGFAVRQIDNIIYIFAAEYKGVINGVYDFLEENAGIIWTRGVEELGTLYETAETVAVKKADYREKSPFRYRTWNSCGMGSTGIHHIDQDYTYFEARNKINMGGDEIGTQIIDGVKYNLAGSIINSGTATLWIDKYFDEHPEYFMTDKFGEPLRNQYGSNLNFYSMEAAEALAAELIALSEKQGSNIVDHGIQDNQHFCMIVDDGEGGKVDLASLPFTTEDGVTVTPDMKNYKSTVFFNFLNHVARTIKKTNPDIRITTLSYIYTETPPAMPIEDNIIIVFAPIYADDHAPITAPSNASTKANLDGWAKLTKNVMVYNYYFSLPSTIYSRPIAEKVQADLQYYASLGLLGLNPEGNVDSSIEDSDSNKAWDMNTMYMWEMNQLFWDPYLDLDELTRKYCKLAYGEAADDMYRYYELIQEGWDSDDSYVWYTTGADTYIKKLVIDAGVADEVLACLDSAYEKTDGVEQKRIAPIRQTMYEQIDLFTDFETENGVAYYNESGKDVLTAEEDLAVRRVEQAEHGAAERRLAAAGLMSSR